MYKLKQKPEDFIVREMSILKLGDGPYSYFELFKMGWSTLDAIKKIAKAINVKEKDLGFAGMKDKNAVTWQLCSVKNIGRERIESVEMEGIELTYVGKGAEPIHLGELEGNEFEIVIRSVDQEFDVKRSVPNYFGEQRFGSNNYEIGKAIVKKDFKKAAEMMDHGEVKDYLLQHPTDHIGAIRQLPKKLITIYVNSVQSMLWNRCVAEYLSRFEHKITDDPSCGRLVFPVEDVKCKDVPLISFETDFEDGDIEGIYSRVMEEEGISQRDFIIRELPGATPEGGMRAMLMDISELEIYEDDDELDPGKKKLKACFRLGKGSYATMFIRSLFI